MSSPDIVDQKDRITLYVKGKANMKITSLNDYSAAMECDEPQAYAQSEEIKKEILLKLELKSLREELGVKQAFVVKKMKIKQSSVSRIEKKGTNSKLATIKEYLESLGCTSALQVTLPNGQVKLLKI